MQNLVGIVRTESDLRKGVEALGDLVERAQRAGVQGNREYNAGWHTAMDLRHLLTVSEAIALAALERKESRGAHFREDYPDKDENEARDSIIVRKGPDGEMQVTREALSATRADLQTIIEEMQ
jgi:succinate dehydrogenase / fumarate reductase flavoprotein subunit